MTGFDRKVCCVTRKISIFQRQNNGNGKVFVLVRTSMTDDYKQFILENLLLLLLPEEIARGDRHYRRLSLK